MERNSPNMSAIADLLPTPVSSDYKGADPEKVSWENTTKSRGDGGASSLGDIAPLLAPLLPTPAASDGDGGKTSRSGDRRDEPLLGNIAALLPTPNAADGDRGKGPRSEEKLAQTRDGDNRLDRQKGLPDLPRLLPTPAAADSDRRQDYARADRDGSGGDDLVTAAVKATATQEWGKYAPAIELWEALTRPAPPPTEPNTKGNPRLSPAFSEWLMGWALGWVTEKGLISRNDQLRIIGNGVVPQQCAVALIQLLNVIAQDTQ
jgi:DNA (cytosine-5)-methyltransferase 1